MSFSPKTPTEIVRYGFDFGPLLDHGESIATSSWSVFTTATIPVSAATMLFGSPITDLSPVVRHLIQGGSDGVSYTVGCQITTSGGQILETATDLDVLE
jgi:hypothetical protein